MDVFRPYWPNQPKPPTWLPPSAAYPLIGTLVDNFNDNSLDAAKWTSFANSGATVAETTQQIVVTVDNSASSVYGGIDTVQTFSLRESEITFKVATYPTQSANTQIYLVLRYDASNRIVLDSINGTWTARYRDNAGSDSTHSTYVGTDPYLKVSSSAGTVHYWHSADGVSYTEIGTGQAIVGTWLGTITLAELAFGHFSSDIASNTCNFDDVNVAGVAAQTITAKLPLMGVGT